MLAPTPTNNKPVIYLAGKIAQRDWRTQIFGPRFGAISGYSDAAVRDELFNVTYVQDMGSFLYTGPFFIACDHGCWHGPATHGAGAAGPTGCGSGEVNKAEMRARILEVNFNRIRRADFVLAYINELDCYGTFIEIGQAHTLNKKLVLGIGPNISAAQLDDLWMARACTICGGQLWRGTPQQVFNKFLEWIAAQTRGMN